MKHATHTRPTLASKTGILMLVLLLTCLSGHAQYRWQNLWGFYIDGSYANVLGTTIPDVFPHGGGAATGGIVYEGQYNHFIIQAGAGFRWQQNNTLGPDSIFHKAYPDQVDTQGKTYTLHYGLENRLDVRRIGYVQVPIMAGMQFRGFYWLAGVKAQVHVTGTDVSTIQATTTAEYDRYISQFGNMSNHGLRTSVPITRKGDIHVNPDALLSAEVGWDFGPYVRETGFGSSMKNDFRIRVAAFADYGVANFRKKQPDWEWILPPKDDEMKLDMENIEMHHAFSSNVSNGAKLHNFNVGLKFTILISAPTNDCINCYEHMKVRKNRKCLHCDGN